jgi:hypothetical protein
MLILISVCLLTAPGDCHEERLSFSFEEVNAVACMVRSQEAIAKWQRTHPGYRVDRWKCIPRGTGSDRI